MTDDDSSVLVVAVIEDDGNDMIGCVFVELLVGFLYILIRLCVWLDFCSVVLIGMERVKFKSVLVSEQHSVPTETWVFVWVALSLSDWHIKVESTIDDDGNDDIGVETFSWLKFFNNSNASGLIMTGWWDETLWRDSSIWLDGSGRRR